MCCCHDYHQSLAFHSLLLLIPFNLDSTQLPADQTTINTIRVRQEFFVRSLFRHVAVLDHKNTVRAPDSR